MAEMLPEFEFSPELRAELLAESFEQILNGHVVSELAAVAIWSGEPRYSLEVEGEERGTFGRTDIVSETRFHNGTLTRAIKISLENTQGRTESFVVKRVEGEAQQSAPLPVLELAR